jgi:hypothetical protein
MRCRRAETQLWPNRVLHPHADREQRIQDFVLRWEEFPMRSRVRSNPNASTSSLGRTHTQEEGSHVMGLLALRRGTVRPFFGIAAALLLTGCTRTAILYQPPPVFFQMLTTRYIEGAIFEGCSRHGWIPTKVQDGVIDATLNLRTHVAVVRINYDGESFTVKYVRSENLNYGRRGDGSEVIHPNYNSWVKNLTPDITMALAQRR